MTAAKAIGSVGVFHLVRAANGIETFRTFIQSLRAAPPTSSWTLELIFKGFNGKRDTEPYRARVGDMPVHASSVDDSGYDISSYFAATAATQHDTLIFFNSFCEIVDVGWFSSFVDNFSRPDIGVVGATGSLESVVRNHVIYAGVDRTLIGKATNYAIAAGLLSLFPPFPNPHIRTNAFMIGRRDFLATKRFPVKRRLAALIYESGWLSLTRQIKAMGLAPLVVDSRGRGHAPEEWADAHTFRSGEQENVVVRDNRIKEYELASGERKRMLRRLAFGDQARS